VKRISRAATRQIDNSRGSWSQREKEEREEKGVGGRTSESAVGGKLRNNCLATTCHNSPPSPCEETLRASHKDTSTQDLAAFKTLDRMWPTMFSLCALGLRLSSLAQFALRSLECASFVCLCCTCSFSASLRQDKCAF
jgi:hypothetical protein